MRADERLFEGVDQIQERASQADRLVELALAAGSECLRDRQDEAFVRVPQENGPTVVTRLAQKRFGRGSGTSCTPPMRKRQRPRRSPTRETRLRVGR